MITSNNHFTDRISVVNWVSLLWHLFRTWSDFGWSPLSKTNHLLTAANSCTTEAIVSSCSSGRGDRGWEYERNEANKICGELGALTIFTHMLNGQSLRKSGMTDGLSDLEIYKDCKAALPNLQSEKAFNCTIRRALLSKYVTALILPSFQ